MSSAVDLSDEDTKRIFKEDILPDMLATRHARGPAPNQPTALLLGGQPAAGKTPQLNEAARQLSRDGATMVINGDDLYSYHPKHDTLIATHGSPAAMEMMKGQAGKWVKLALEEAQRRKVNIVMETTMRQPEVVARSAADFRQNGYKVHARVLAVPPEESWVGNRFRYEQMQVLGTAARLTPRSIHDEAAKQLLTTVSALEKGRAVDSIDVVRRDPRESAIYSNELQGGEWKRAPGAAQAVELERNRPWTEERVARYQTAWKTVEMMAGQRLVEQGIPPQERAQQLAQIGAERKDGLEAVQQRNEQGRGTQSGLGVPGHTRNLPQQER